MRRLPHLVSLLILAACSQSPPGESDPIASLSAKEPSATFDAAYWSAQAKDETATWSKALDLCRDNRHKLSPNCQTVGQVQFLELLRSSKSRTSNPYDGQEGIPLPQALSRVLEQEPPQE